MTIIGITIRPQEGDINQGALDPFASIKFLDISIGTVIGAPELAALRSAGYAWFCPVSAKATKGISVLGKYPDYIKLSNELGARRFSNPTDVWNKMSKVEQ